MKFHGAKHAEDAGVQRIELCQQLAVGGVTPSSALLEKVIKDLEIEAFVLIRPRGGDFCYSEEEFKAMKQNIDHCKILGYSGIVSGVLNEDKSVDIERTKTLVMLSRPMQFTFHRAFDEVPNPFKAMEQLMDLGLDRILTSGDEPKAVDGLKLLTNLKAEAKHSITILPGSGINPDSARLFKEAGFKEIHASASRPTRNDEVFPFNLDQSVSDILTIKAIMDAI